MPPRTIEDIVAEAEIRDIQLRYCRAVDRLDFDLLRGCFFDEATLTYGDFFDGGVEAFVEQGRRTLSAYTTTTHFTGNQMVRVAGDAAWAEHYATTSCRLPATEALPERDFICRLRYVDRLERRAGEWRILRRVMVNDAWRTDPVADLPPRVPRLTGRRDGEDASYALLAEVARQR
jgi:hypothetical protein